MMKKGALAHGRGERGDAGMLAGAGDSGARCQSKLYNPAFLAEKGLPAPPWMEERAPPLPEVFENPPEN